MSSDALLSDVTASEDGGSDVGQAADTSGLSYYLDIEYEEGKEGGDQEQHPQQLQHPPLACTAPVMPASDPLHPLQVRQATTPDGMSSTSPLTPPPHNHQSKIATSSGGDSSNYLDHSSRCTSPQVTDREVCYFMVENVYGPAENNGNS